MFYEIEALSEIYDIEVMHYDIIKESIKRDHIIKLSGNDIDIVTESFNDITISIANLLSTLINKITEFFKKTMLIIKSHSKTIIKFYNQNKDVLMSLTNIDFYVSGYNFNNVLSLKPNLKPLKNMINEYNRELKDLPSININTIKTRQNDFLNEGHLNVLRGEILGTNTPIQQNKFNKVVRAAYRNGDFNEIDIHVTDDTFHTYMSQIPLVNSGVDEADTLRREVIDSLKKIETFFSDKIPAVYNGGAKGLNVSRVNMKDNKFKTADSTETFLEENRDKVEAYMKFKYNQAHEIGNMVSLVLMEYVNAYKDYLALLKEIMTKGVARGTRLNID